MLILGHFTVWADMPDAPGTAFKLSPLTADAEARITAATTTRKLDENGKLVDLQRDYTAYAQQIGRECIKDWRGVADAHGQPVACTPERIDELLRIDPVQGFLVRTVRTLAIARAQQIVDAGNGSAASPSGTGVAA